MQGNHLRINYGHAACDKMIKHPEKDKRSIRFGVMCNGMILQDWQARCLQKLLDLENVELVLLIINSNPNKINNLKNKFIDLLKNPERFQHLIWYIYGFFQMRKSEALRDVDLSKNLSSIPLIECKTIQKGKFSQFFNEEDIGKIREFELDFILRFGFNIIRGAILDVPRFGIWSFHHDDEQKYRGDPPGFWEIFHQDHVTGAILQRLTDTLDGGVILKKGFFKTSDISYIANLDSILMGCFEWPAQVCIDIQNNNAHYLEAAPSNTAAPIFHTPKNIEMILFFKRLIKNIFHEFVNIVFFNVQWNIGIVNKPIHSFLQDDFKPEIRWMKVKKDRFMADPFAVQKDNVVYIFCTCLAHLSF